MEQTVNQILKRAAEKTGFVRARYNEKNVPTTIQNVTVFLFLGDLSSSFILSSLLLRRFREEAKGSKYFVLCGWPGQDGLFPYVDEYWEVKEESHLRAMYNKTDGFDNKSELVAGYQRILNTFFEEVLDSSVLKPYYDRGLQEEFFNRFKHVRCFLPSIPSSMVLGHELNRRLASPAKKVVVYPAKYIRWWQNGKVEPMAVTKDFWVELTERLLTEGITPVVYQPPNTWDLSPNFVDKALFYTDTSVLGAMSLFRAAGCVLDVFSGVSKYALGARTPFLACEERQSYNGLKGYEIDDLCGRGVPRKYLYSFPSICDELGRNLWNYSLFDGIISKLLSLLDSANRDIWPSTSESYDIVPYSTVREIKAKKLGTHFIRVPKY
jgi:hypothetical protein